MGFLRKILGKQSSASLLSINFDDSRYLYQGERNGARIWYLPEGGGIGIYFFQRPPNLPTGLVSVAKLQQFYAGQMSEKQRVIECRMQSVDDVKSIWLITIEPDPQTGSAVYLGSLTIPFKDFSFVIKMQCQEQGITGMREAKILDRALASGKASIQDGKLIMQGPSTDDEQFDAEFSQHPLSRIRHELRLIVSSSRIDQRVKSEKHFEPLPDAA